MSRFDLAQALHQPIIFRIGDERIIQDIITVVMLVDLGPQPGQFLE
jgi:hypothetical protein